MGALRHFLGVDRAELAVTAVVFGGVCTTDFLQLVSPYTPSPPEECAEKSRECRAPNPKRARGTHITYTHAQRRRNVSQTRAHDSNECGVMGLLE